MKPDNATGKALKWTSSDPSVAAVDENGNVSAVAKGRAVITATAEDGFTSDSCEVTVRIRLFRRLLGLLG